MKPNRFPPGWDEARVRRVLTHYESQSEEAAAAADDATHTYSGQTFMEVPNRLVPLVRELIAESQA